MRLSLPISSPPAHPHLFPDRKTDARLICMSCVRQAMIDEFDLDQDGEISLEEFFAIMTDE